MTARIVSIGTALPDTRVTQSALRDLFAAQPGFDRKAQRLVGAAFDAAAIDTRHVVLPQLAGAADDGLAVRDGDTLLMPPTARATTSTAAPRRRCSPRPRAPRCGARPTTPRPSPTS